VTCCLALFSIKRRIDLSEVIFIYNWFEVVL